MQINGYGYYSALSKRAEYCDEYVCLSVCVPVCLPVFMSANISPELRVLRKFCACYLLPRLGDIGDIDIAIRYKLPVLRMTSCLQSLEIGRILKVTQQGQQDLIPRQMRA